MAKLHRNSKTTSVETTEGKGFQVDHTDHFDDTPLPEAQELAKYKEVDPGIVVWLMAMTEKEQNHRHETDRIRAREIKRINNRVFTVDITRILCAFLIVISGMGLSYLLIVHEKTLLGSIFAGGTILGAVAMFLNIRKNAPASSKK